MLLDRRRFLLAAAAGLAMPRVGRAATAPKRMAVVLADGGWDVSFVFDPKFDSDHVDGPWVDEDPANPEDREAVRTYGDLRVGVNDFKRPSVSTFFEKWHDRSAVVNGIWMGAIAHATARVRVLTGTQSSVNSAWATIVGHSLGADLPLGSIDLSGGSYVGPLAASTGQIGFQSQIQALMLDEASFPAPRGAPYTLPQFRPDTADRDALYAHLLRRNAAFRGEVADGGRNDALLAARDEALLRARRFRSEGAATIESLTLGAAPSLLQQAELAVDLLGGELCRSVTLDSRVFWDTHDLNVGQHANFELLFAGVDHLVTRLDEVGLLDDTLVVVLSEFTRTPTLNSRGGKDHWPHASFLLIGGNVKGGRTYGGTDDRLESLPVSLETGEVDAAGELNKYDNMAAGLLAALDVDPGPWYPTIRPYRACFG